jgi:isopentenyldiphosphate isomerase
MKYFDVVNVNDEIIGSATAAECHSDPRLIHRVVHFTIVDSVRNKILISQRSPNVKYDSGMWCFMGEHLLQGDDYPTAVYRGLKDELGFDGSGGIREKCHTIFYQENQTEFARFFVARYRNEKITPNQAEISQMKRINLNELRENKHQYSAMTQYWIDHADWDEIMRFTSE